MIKKFSSRETTNHISACFKILQLGINDLLVSKKYIEQLHRHPLQVSHNKILI